ncbi:MAG TPA: polyprenyl synthetase family protein, partial [Acidimicrobiales bacterium]|nr:polyprenyl synthetase family protein [Acidimicrobiales bacterium]
GEGRRFGEGVAILVGDLAFVYADILLAGAPPDAAEVFAQLRIEVNVGQYLDLLGTVRGDVGLDQARRISRYKSGMYTVERPLHLGAALAGRLDQLAAPLSAFGGPLGEAFQLRDELLGAFGDPAVTGKPVGQDLREGKPTTLLAFAVAAADAASAKLLADRFGAPDLTPAEVAELQTILERTGARVRVEAAIQELLSEALAALDVAPFVDGPGGRLARQQLAELAYFAAGRDH